MMPYRKTPFERAITLAAISGLRMTLGPAFLSISRRGPNTGGWAIAAMGEMLLDKIGILPARYRPVALIPHALAGAWVARESLRHEGVDDPMAPIAGAVVAAGVSCVAPLVRMTLNQGLGISDAVLGAGEDFLALKMGTGATGTSMDQLPGIAHDAIEDLRHEKIGKLWHSTCDMFQTVGGQASLSSERTGR
jgi:hypothetical protein